MNFDDKFSKSDHVQFNNLPHSHKEFNGKK